MDKPHKNIGVLGAGLMGHGIALTFAHVGHHVQVFDPQQASLDSLATRVEESMVLLGRSAAEIKSALSKIDGTKELETAVKSADLVVEAAPEKLELKQNLFAEVEQYAPKHAILASNTSVIQISKIVDQIESRHRCLGTHWWNPPHQIPLVEVVKTQWTDDAVAQETLQLLIGAGKKAVLVEKDVPGFIGNRLQHALWREAISLVENGICTADAVDEVVKASFGRRLAVLGPLENADLVGIELTQDIHNQVLFDLESSGQSSSYLQKLLDEKRTGMSAGKGFRDWQPEDLQKTKARISEHLSKLEKILTK